MNVPDVLNRIQIRLNETPHLLRLGRMFSTCVLLEAGSDSYILTFEKGVLEDIRINSATKMPWSFALRTDENALFEFWQPIPKPGFHDIFGLAKMGRAQIEGDIILLVRNLRFFKETLALGRGTL